MKKLTSDFIHICPDEKFIDSAISLFNEVDSNNHIFIIISKERKLSYIKEKNIFILSPNRLILFILKNRTKLRDKKIIIHSAPRISKIITLLLHKKTSVIWIGFGFDYYCYNDIIHKKYKLNFHSLFLKRVDFFSPVIESEYSIVKNYEPKFSASLLSWNYDVVTDFFAKKPSVNGKNILLGNSATSTNNHSDALTKLSKSHLDKNRKIIIPLSYGSNEYKETILELISKTPLNIISLTYFMKASDYYEIICSCSHVIMNHDRQQAYGNIMISLFIGAKVFLKKENPLYDHLVKCGFVIFPTEEINKEINLSIDEEIRKKNRDLIFTYFSRETFLLRTKRFIESINAIK